MDRTHVEAFQNDANNVKDMVITRINSDYGLNIKPENYLIVSDGKGLFGTIWDKIFNKDNDKNRVVRLIKVDHGYDKPDKDVKNKNTKKST